jgi:tetratricopeptide (TPR) repeat protein
MLIVLFLLLGCSSSTDNNSLRDKSMTNTEEDSSSRINSNDTISLETLASILYGRDQYIEAIDAYSKLLLVDSLNGQFYFRKAYCLMQIDQDQKALVSFLKAADLNFERYDAYKNIGLIYCKSALYNPDEASKYFKKCLEMNPNDEVVKKFLYSLAQKENSNNL